MLKTRYFGLGMLVALLAICTPHAFADSVTSATGTATCNSYNLTFTESNLVAGQTYIVQWNLTFTPTSGVPINVVNTAAFTASASSDGGTTPNQPLGPLSSNYTVSGTVTLIDYTTGTTWNTIPIVFSPSTVNCAPPPPPPSSCTGTNTNSSNFNGTPVSSGKYIWFHAIFKASGIPSTGATVNFTNSTISFTAGGTSYNLQVPNAQVTFSPMVSCTSTTYNTLTNTWETVVPVSGDDEIFLSGLAWPVPSGGLPGGVNPVNWTGSFSVSPQAPKFQIQWQWAAAVHSNFTTNYNALGLKAGHQSACESACGQNYGDHAGRPEGVNGRNAPWKDFTIDGARGRGGSNWTGTWSGTNVVPLQCTQ